MKLVNEQKEKDEKWVFDFFHILKQERRYLVTDHHKTAVFLAAVDDFQFHRIAAVGREFEGGLALGHSLLDVLGIIKTLVKTSIVRDVNLHGDKAACLSNHCEFLMTFGGKGVFGALACLYETGFGEDGAI